MKEITRKLLKHLVWMKPGKEKDAARRVTDADQRNVKNGGKKNSVGVVLIPAAETGIATADVAPVPSSDNAPTDMSPAAIRLEGVAAAGSLEEAEVDDRGDNDLNNSSASSAEDDAAILSRDFQKLNIGFPATCGEKPTIPRTAAATPTPPTTRVPVACDSSSPDGEDVREGSKSSDSATKTASIADADKDDGKQQKDKDAAEQKQEEEGVEDDDDDEEEAREFNATMMRLSLTVRKKEVELDTFLERGPNGFSGSIARDRGPYHGAYQSRGAMFEEGDVLTEGHALTQNIAHNCDAQITRLLIGLNVARLPILHGDEVETFLGRMAPENLERPEFSQAQDGASDGYPSPPSFGHDSDSIDSIDCGPSASPTSHFMEAGRIKELKDRVAKDLHGSQPSPDYMASMSPGSPWSTSTEGSSKSATPPQVYRSDPPGQPPLFPLSEKTPPNFVDQVDRPYHNWMRGQFMAKAKLEGYGWDKANKCPELITLLRDAERTRRADHQRIYECARGHMKYHIALLYEKDDNDKTALFYAARLYFDDHVAGFVAECLVEAQERCLKSNSGRRYRVDEELYGEEKDNVFHCLARWHRDENYVAMAATLLSIAPLVALLYRPNKAGRLPVDLCQHSDMRAMLDPRNRPYLMGAPL